MNSERKRSSEFKRYRQVLVGLYVSAAGAGFLLLAASVTSELLFRKPVISLPKSAIVANNPNPRDLLECNELVLEQLTNLSAMSNELIARPLGPRSNAREDLASDWKNFSTQWRDQWDVIDARCRFSELAGTTMGVAYDRMAQVHESLPAMRLKYNSLLARFDKEQAAELTEMRRALDTSHRAISKQQLDPEEQPPSQMQENSL